MEGSSILYTCSLKYHPEPCNYLSQSVVLEQGVYDEVAVSCVGVAAKEGRLERMGMEGIISDMRASKQRLLAKYTEAHCAAQHHLSAVAAVRSAVDKACAPPPGPQSCAEADARFATQKLYISKVV